MTDCAVFKMADKCCFRPVGRMGRRELDVAMYARVEVWVEVSECGLWPSDGTFEVDHDADRFGLGHV